MICNYGTFEAWESIIPTYFVQGKFFFVEIAEQFAVLYGMAFGLFVLFPWLLCILPLPFFPPNLNVRH